MKLAFTLLAFVALAQAGSWKVQYFYDRDDSKLILNDFQFVNSLRGYAAGFKETKKLPDPKPCLLVTDDGGKTWVETYPPSVPESIFFISDTTGWMAAASGIWQTTDAGKSWRNLSTLVGVTRLWFTTDQRGFAIGRPKMMKETRDGGTKWKDVPAATNVQGKPENTVYTAIAFQGRVGIVAGVSEPNRPPPDEPSWVDPVEAGKRRLWPTLSIGIRTSDHGDTWNAQTAPVFGVTTKMRVNGSVGMSVVRYAESFEVPSEVYAVNAGGQVQSIFKQKNRIVTDAGWLGPDAILVAIEPPGKMNALPFPGKVKVLRSLDLATWTEMDVSYKAFAGNAMLSVIDEANAWIATDTGMILQLQP